MRKIRQGIPFQQQALGTGGVGQVLFVVLHRQRILKLWLVGSRIRAPGVLTIEVQRLPGWLAIELVGTV